MRRSTHRFYRRISPRCNIIKAVTQFGGTESTSLQSSVPWLRVLSWVSFRITFLWNVILKASQSYQCLCVVLTPDSSMSKHPAIVTGAWFYPHGSEAPAQQERCGNVGKPLYYFKSRLL